MLKIIDREFVKTLLTKNYNDNFNSEEDGCDRELIEHSVANFPGAFMFTLSGSGPKGYGIYFPVGIQHYTLTLFDCQGKRFKDMYLTDAIDFKNN